MRNSNMLNPPSNKIMINKNKESTSFVQMDDQNSKKQLNIDEAFTREQQISKFYKDKNERNTLKCKFLFNKLTTLGNLQGIPEMIAVESGQIETKIKQLQQMLFLRRGQQMKKIRKKVKTFLNQINFDIEDSDLQKIQDQIQFILFLIDIFQQKFKQMTEERSQIDEIIKRLHVDQPTQEIDISKQRQQMRLKIQALSSQIQQLKLDQAHRNGFGMTMKDINSTNKDNNNWQQIVNTKSLQNDKYIRKLRDLQNDILQLRQKNKLLQGSIQRYRKDQIKNKEKYRMMQQLKNQRIKLLEENLKIKLQM